MIIEYKVIDGVVVPKNKFRARVPCPICKKTTLHWILYTGHELDGQITLVHFRESCIICGEGNWQYKSTLPKQAWISLCLGIKNGT